VSAAERNHIKSFAQCFLHDISPFDWDTDLLATSRVAEDLLRHLSKDKNLMRALIKHAAEDNYLWTKCEEDLVEDKIVLWDDIDKNLRIRLRMSTAPQQRLAHCHRFSFSNLVLRGSYTHWIYKPVAGFDETTYLEDVEEVVLHEDNAGDCFTIHHNTLHSTPFTEEHTISLVLRGNPVKERAPVMFKERRQRAEFAGVLSPVRGGETEPSIASEGDMFWRVGEEKESPARRVERQMRSDRHAFWLRRLEEYGII
jgi:hypothetical protein